MEIDHQPAPRRVFEQVGVEVDLAYAFAVHEVHLDALYACLLYTSDTIGDLAVACNAVLALRGLPQHSYEEYCHFVGNGIMRLVERCV